MQSTLVQELRVPPLQRHPCRLLFDEGALLSGAFLSIFDKAFAEKQRSLTSDIEARDELLVERLNDLHGQVAGQKTALDDEFSSKKKKIEAVNAGSPGNPVQLRGTSGNTPARDCGRQDGIR